MLETPVIIYGVCDPRTDEIRYVGKTKYRLDYRIGAHVKTSVLRQRTHREFWFNSLIRAGVYPDAFIIETVAEVEWRDAEQFWIAYFKSLGARLVNTSIGGDGATGVKDTPEVRAKKSAGMRGKKKTPEHLVKILAGPGVFKKGQLAWNTGRKSSVETCRKIGDVQRGKPKGEWSEERRKKFIELIKTRKKVPVWSPARRAAHDARYPREVSRGI